MIRSENPIRPSDGVLENIYGRGVRFAAEELPIPHPQNQSPLVIASKRTLLQYLVWHLTHRGALRASGAAQAAQVVSNIFERGERLRRRVGCFFVVC